MILEKYLERYLNEDNQLIGVQFQSDWLPIMLRYQTSLTVKGDTIELVASPNIEQQIPLENFIKTIENEGYGELLGKKLVSSKDYAINTDDIVKGAEYRRANLYSFQLFLGADDTEITKNTKEFTITASNNIKESYTLIEINVVNDTFSGCLRILLKKKTSDGLTFFTGLLDTPLSRLNAKKLLYVFTHKNVTGLGLIGVRHTNGKIETNLYPITSDLSIEYKNGIYNIRTDTGTLMFHYDDINQVNIKKVGLRSYIFTLELGKNNVELMFGI